MADSYGEPHLSYANVTGVVNVTAAAEIVVLIATLTSALTVTETAQGTSAQPSPLFGVIQPETASRLRGELTGIAAAIAAAPAA